ncbi:MAG: hypothetical protein HKP60_12275 [Eudoraea sp.]|nr:hypothetical protein [Eudoraea sp.]NNJ41638.1 hypothetical protein [Eudoraea sp.]
MPCTLKNNTLEVHLDLPMEGYSYSRFDWSGKITKVKYRDIPMTTIERTDNIDPDLFGKGLYNEFGIETALGFDEIETGDWFHKIGVGALKKHNTSYLFSDSYEIRPARFEFETKANTLIIRCVSETLNGYAYLLQKEFTIKESSLLISYQLQNTGEKSIHTDEYAHNFLAINQAKISKDYVLKFPFHFKEKGFEMFVNPEQQLTLNFGDIGFNGSPKEQFFISHLNGIENVPASWELQNLNHKLGIREHGSFSTNKVNLWGWEHVVSPELFHQISIEPGETTEWSRTYEFFEVK